MLQLPLGILYMSIVYVIGICFSCGLIFSTDIVGNVLHDQVGPWSMIEAFGPSLLHMANELLLIEMAYKVLSPSTQ